MSSDLTRRQWAAAFGAAAMPARAQAPAAEDAAADARHDVSEALERLRKFKLPASAEPAFVFKP